MPADPRPHAELIAGVAIGIAVADELFNGIHSPYEYAAEVGKTLRGLLAETYGMDKHAIHDAILAAEAEISEFLDKLRAVRDG